MKLKPKREALALALAALGAGLINALVGAGGGVLLIFTMQTLVSGIEGKSVYAITNAAIMLLSFISVVSYVHRGVIEPATVAPYIIPALIGGTAGALLLGRMKTKYLRLIFAALTLYSGVKMIV